MSCSALQMKAVVRPEKIGMSSRRYELPLLLRESNALPTHKVQIKQLPHKIGNKLQTANSEEWSEKPRFN
jgi:hypothetical protein